MSDENTEPDLAARHGERAHRIRTEMGGAVRQHIADLLDDDSFEEIGTFTRSSRVEDQDVTPGDGKIGGIGQIDGKTVVVCGDDSSVLEASTSEVGGRRLSRLLDLAVDRGVPFIYLAQSSGARIPDSSGAEGFTELGSLTGFAGRKHRIPLATVIVGDSFGDSSFVAAMSDFTVQVEGSVLAMNPPSLIRAMTGEDIDAHELGGAEVHARKTGFIDLAVKSNEEAYDAIHRWLSYLPPNAWTPAPRSDPTGAMTPDPELAAIVPRKRTRAYDGRRLVAKIVDEGSLFEIRPGIGRALTCGFGRIDGWPVTIIASNPIFHAGALDPASCHKAIRMLVLCDAFQIPAIFFQDVPGFLVGRQVEHDRVLHRSIRFLEALLLCSAPTLTVIIRKAFGLAYQCLNGPVAETDGVYAWPGAEIGFMDPEVGVNVLYGDRMSDKDKADMAAEMGETTSPYEAAGPMNIDEVIDPATTRQVLARDLAMLAHRKIPPLEDRPLTYWPTC